MATFRGHKGVAPDQVGCAVITVSDTRTEDDDESGGLVRDLLEDAGHPIRWFTIVPDDPIAIRTAVTGAVERNDVLAVVVNGGTGIAPRDVTIESLANLWVRELPGFGELFRMLSFEEIGTPAFLSRATAGVIAGKFVAVLPGSPAACRLGMERLLVPQLRHVAALLGAP